jgi:general secretion pathway protein L
VNLLPADNARAANPRARLNLALGATCVVLLALVLAQSLYLRANQVSELEAAIASAGQAREVAQIRKQIRTPAKPPAFSPRGGQGAAGDRV